MLNLYSLPDVLVSSICENWLDLKNVAKLDTSLCRKPLRLWMLSIFKLLKQSDDTVSDTSCSVNFYKWINLRHIKLKYLNLSHETVAYLTSHCLCYDYVTAICFPNALGSNTTDMKLEDFSTIFNACSQLQHVTVDHEAALNTCSPAVLKQLNSLTMLNQLVHPTTTSSLTERSVCCGNLRKLHFSRNLSNSAIQAIFTANPHISDFKLYFSCDNSIVSFLNLLMYTPNRVTNLTLTGSWVEINLFTAIAQYFTHRGAALQQFTLQYAMYFHVSKAGNGILERHLSINDLTLENCNRMLNAVPNITHLSLMELSKYKCAMLLPHAIQLYAQSLIHISVYSLTTVEASMLILGCPKLKSIRVLACSTASRAVLSGLHLNIDWIDKNAYNAPH